MPRKDAQNHAEFNVRVTVDRLAAYLLEAEDAVGGGGKLKDSPAMLRVRDTPIATPSYIAMAQLCRHAVNAESRPADALPPHVAFEDISGSCPAMRLGCPSSPRCKPCSAAEAMRLLADHQAEVGQAQNEGAMGEGLGPAMVEFINCAGGAIEALRRVQVASRKLQPAETPALLAATWFGSGAGLYSILCKARPIVDGLVFRLLKDLESLQAQVATLIKSPQLREDLKANTKPKNLLLNWVTFTLHEGGFRHAEIVELVDDGSDPLAAKDPVSEQRRAEARVRERLRSLNGVLRENS
jgi:hypothetical protein